MCLPIKSIQAPRPNWRLWLSGILLSGVVGSTAIAQSTWTPKTSGTTQGLSGVIYGGGKFVVVGESGTILTSADGEAWTVRESGTEQSLRGVTYGAGKFLAVGQGGTALTSTDGITWTARDARTTKFLSAAAFGNGVFVAVGGSGHIRYSADGINWELGISITSSFLQGVTFGGGKFVAVGASGRITHSTDGQTWTLASSRTSAYLSGITHVDGSFLATGQSGTALSSPDAIDWTNRAGTAGTFVWLRAVSANGSQSVAVGAEGTIVHSPDGIDWTAASSGVSVELMAVAYGSGHFVIVGCPTGSPPEGLILTSPDETPSGLSFETWRQLVFTEEELGDLLISGADADPNCDGISNFSAYAFGLPPFGSTAREALPRGSVIKDDDEQPHHAITFMRPADRLGHVYYSVFCSSDLHTWLPLDEPAEILSEAGGIETLRVVDSNPVDGRKHYRLELSGG